MNISSSEIKQQLKAVSANMATDQVSFVELRRPMGAFFNLNAISPGTNAEYTESCKRAISFAGDDFRGMLYSMQLCEELLTRPAPEDLLLRTMEARALIQVFFLDLRSVFDYMLMATIILFEKDITSGSNKEWKSVQKRLNEKGHTPNFAEFRKKVLENETEANSCFTVELVAIWKNCGWFDEINTWRNSITHEGAYLTVKNENPDLFFIETVRGDFPLKTGSLPGNLFDSDHAISFKVVGGIYSGLLLSFLNQWAERLQLKANLPLSTQGCYIGRGGTLFEGNMKRALQAMP